MLATDESFWQGKVTKERRILMNLVHYNIRLSHFTAVNLGICLFVCFCLFVCLFAQARYICGLKYALLQLQKFVAEKKKTEGSFVAAKFVCRDKQCGRLCNSVYVTSVSVAKNVHFVAADMHFDARQTCAIAATILKLRCQQFPMIDFAWL